MDEEEELENTLIGQQQEEEAPAVNTADIIMGAGIPASAFGQAPAVNPFSMAAAGQVNPMMQQQSLEAPVQPQVTFRDYSVPEPPRASALSVFTPGGDLKSGIDVNAITPSPESTAPFAVNTALNQEVPVDPALEKSKFFEPGGFGYEYLGPRLGANIGQFAAEQLYGTDITAEGQATGFPVDRPSLAGDILTLPGNVLRGLDFVAGPPVRAIPGVTKALADYTTGATGVQAQQDAQRDAEASTQVPSNINSFTGETIENPTPFDFNRSDVTAQQQTFMDANQQAVANAMANQNQQISNAQIQGATQGQEATAPTSGLTTVGGTSLSEFLSGQAMPEQGFVREERRLGGRGVTLSPERMNELSAEREARLAARLPGDQAVSDRERRLETGEGISMADRTAMAKANARGATPREVAYGNQVAAELGVDVRTGQPLETETGGLTFDQQLALRKQNFAEGKFDYDVAKDLKAELDAGIKASKEASANEAKAESSGKTMVSAISNMNEAMTRMGGRSNEFFGSGFFGRTASFIPGTSAYDQVADAEFLQSNVALGAMAELKRLSSTGATGFGSLSERELNVLTAKFANLNPFVSPDLFRSNLRQLQGEFNNMLDNAWNTHSAEYGEDAANKIYGNRGGGASGTTGGTGGTTSGAIPNDRNVASAADTLLSDPKYN